MQEQDAGMKAGVSIRTKMLAVTVLLLGALVAVAALVLVEVIGPSFQTLERQMARSTVEIIRNTVRRDFAALNVLVKDWSYWDDTYRYVVGQQDDFASANLIEETLAGASLNLLLIEDIAGQVIWGKTYNLEEEEFFELADFAEGSELLARLKELALSSENGLRGLVGTSAGPMMIAAHPILTSAETGPPRGVLMMGRLLNDAILADVGDTLDLIVQASPVQASDTHATTDESGPCGAEIRIQEAGADSLRACITLKDVFGQPLVVLSTSIDRTVAAIGRTAQATGLGITGVAGLILILVFLFSQQVLVLGPLRRLTSSVEQVGLQAEPDTPLPETRKDEFGILAQSFNRMLERVARLTNFDAVTGLPNRRLFHDRANQVLRIARRAGGKAAVLFIDLDDFKAINDTRGHSVGDALLRVIGEELSDLMRETDTVARFGGDEFVIVIHPVDVRSRINELSERIQLRFQQPFRVSGTTLFTNASIGVAVFPDDAEAVETLISLADAAMYQAKGDGGRQIAFIDTDAYVADGHLRSLELSFREALSADQLHLVFQSQVDLRSEEVVGHEALVRWRHPEQGVLAAGRFIHLAESAANFARFDAWVLRAACSALASGQTHGGAKLKHISVNICARHVQSPALVELVKDTLQETGVKPDQLTLEITETVMVTRPEAAIEVLSALRGIGVRVAIDDFGTGYASLAALHRFPIDELKIDRSFVAGLPDDRAALAIAQATLTLARTFALDVVAEGVETAQQRDTLIEAGCTIGQGFLWSPLS
ncbi:putative bifunctional diguanylate cyclase/phosphodiesterase [Thiorhodovibrio winogradskyi]|uniref:putative bifunctional diguanylate cyclase/phosphodiesterase n=2 Tax=Thiorhodovibrio TaxID=61593 RepID=UPI0019146319|nr:EAL domain-containing protein [Thiorhodovibrio winogradskyi]